MAITYVNTEEVNDIARDIMDLSQELNDEINNLFSRFADVPMVTQEWIGNQANYYFNRISSDKKQYTEFIGKIRNIGNELNKNVYEIDSCIRKNNDNER